MLSLSRQDKNKWIDLLSQSSSYSTSVLRQISILTNKYVCNFWLLFLSFFRQMLPGHFWTFSENCAIHTKQYNIKQVRSVKMKKGGEIYEDNSAVVQVKTSS